MFREALGYPTRAPEGGRSVIVGGTLLLVIGVATATVNLDVTLLVTAVALLPWLAVRGYYVRVIRTTIGRQDPTPPRFGDFGRLLSDGIRAAVIAVGYLLPAALVLGPLVYARGFDRDLASLFAAAGVPASLSGAALSVAGILAMIAVMYLLGALYALPVAVANFAYTGRLRAAFDLRTVVGGAASEDYVVVWLVSLLLQVLILPVAYLLKVIIVGFYLHFLVAVGVRYCYGRGVGDALGLDPVITDPRALDDESSVVPAVRPIEESNVSRLRTPRSDVEESRRRGNPGDQPTVTRSLGAPGGDEPSAEEAPNTETGDESAPTDEEESTEGGFVFDEPLEDEE